MFDGDMDSFVAVHSAANMLYRNNDAGAASRGFFVRPVDLAGRTHTKLEQTALAGSTELWLQEPVSWDADSMTPPKTSSANKR